MSVASRQRNMTASSGASQYSDYSQEEITSLMPNLPGYRPRQPKNPQRKASFDIVNGSQFLKQSAVDEMENNGEFADDAPSSLSIVLIRWTELRLHSYSNYAIHSIS
jgi:hypothetical protein